MAAYQVLFQKDENELKVVYTGEVNLYEFAEAMRIEILKLEEILLGKVK